MLVRYQTAPRPENNKLVQPKDEALLPSMVKTPSIHMLTNSTQYFDIPGSYSNHTFPESL